MQAWLKGEGVSGAWGVVGEAVGLRGEAFQGRGGVSLEKRKGRVLVNDLDGQTPCGRCVGVCAYLQER